MIKPDVFISDPDSPDVLLREFRDEDLVVMVGLANNEKVARNLRDGFPHPYTVADGQRFFDMVRAQNPVTFFAIEYRGNYAGNIGLLPGTDVYRHSAEIGYFIGEPFWNRGIATAAVKLITRFGFETMNFARIHTGVFDYNTASMRVLEKCGFLPEGVFRISVYKSGGFHDEVRYALINPALRR